MDNFTDSLNQTNWSRYGGEFSPPLKAEVFGFCGREGAAPPAGVQVCQVHGTVIVDAASATSSTEADALITSGPDLCLILKTADCLPVLIHSPGVVAAIHAGWRGLAAGILRATHAAMAERQKTPHSWTVLIGPAICSSHFEVGPEVVAAFRERAAGLSQPQLDLCTTRGRDDRWHFDLKLAAVLQFLHMGVPAQQIHVHDDCTYCRSEKWYSYRRDGKQAGRIYSWIRNA